MKPILFTGEMVRAIRAGRKTQTRRRLKPEIEELVRYHAGEAGEEESNVSFMYESHIDDDRNIQPPEWLVGSAEYPEEGVIPLGQCPYGKPGDQIYVKEAHWAWGRWETRFDAKKGRDAWRFVDMTRECGKEYQFEQPAPIGTRAGVSPAWHRRPSLFMPRMASRITLEIVSVRVERLQDISEADAKAEGCDNSESEGAQYCGWYEKPRRAFRRIWEQINGNGSWNANPWVWVVEFRVIDHTTTE